MTDWPKTYYACIFTNQRSEQGRDLYPMMSDRMVELAKTQPGFLGVESVRGDDEIGITVSYWETREAIAAWGRHGRACDCQTPWTRRILPMVSTAHCQG